MDLAVLSAWDRAHANGAGDHSVFRSSFNDAAFKILRPGSGVDKVSVVAQYNDAHWKSKRKAGGDVSVTRPEAPDAPLKKPFNRDKFNFNKVAAGEKLCSFTTQPTAPYASAASPNEYKGGEASGGLILVNVSPLFRGHSLVLPAPEAEQPQELTLDAVRIGLRILAACERADSRMMFNSQGAFSSVNHLHLHLLVLEGTECPGGIAPVEAVSLVRPRAHKKHVGVTLSVTGSAWSAVFFCVEATADISPDEVAAAVFELVVELYRGNTPFHLYMVSPRKVYVIPRQNQAVQERSKGLRQAVCEVVGLQVCLGPEQFEEVTNAMFHDRLSKTVSISEDAADAFADAAGWGLPPECPWPILLLHDPVAGLAPRHMWKNTAAAAAIIAYYGWKLGWGHQ